MAGGDFSIRPAAVGDLQGLTTLYQHLNPTDPVLSADVAMERFAPFWRSPA